MSKKEELSFSEIEMLEHNFSPVDNPFIFNRPFVSALCMELYADLTKETDLPIEKANVVKNAESVVKNPENEYFFKITNCYCSIRDHFVEKYNITTLRDSGWL